VDLASRIGLEGAEEILERLAAGERDGRVSSADVLQMLEEAEKSDPLKMADLLHQMRDPGERKEMVLKAAQAVAKEFTGPPERKRGSAAPAPPALSPLPPGEGQGEGFPAASGVSSSPAAVPVPSPLPPGGPAERSPSEGGDQSEVFPAAMASPSFSAPPAPVSSPLSSGEGQGEGLPAATGSSSSATSFSSRLAAERLSARFRLLRLAVDSGQMTFSFKDVERALEAFSDGWARRRALALFLRAGIPQDLSECLELIERFESPRARAFCFAALAGRPGAGKLQPVAPPTGP